MREVTLETGARHDVVQLPSAETTVLVAVESACVREALVAILGAIDGFEVVGEAATGDEALELARQARPHLVVIDQELSDSGPWAIQCMQREQLARRIVALGRNYDGVQARLAGACAYIQVGAPPRDLLSAVRTALAS